MREMWPRHEGCSGYIQKIGQLNLSLRKFALPQRSSFAQINKELVIYSQAVADWRSYVSDVYIEHIVGHFVEGQWVFGGVERKTGRCFLVAVHDRTAETLLGLIESWIEPGTTVISDRWKSYERLSERGYHHLTVNLSLEFVDSESGPHTNTIEVTWRHFNVSLPEYNRKERFEGYIAWYMFRKICFALKEDPFIKFLDLVRNINWAEWLIVSGGGVEESNS
ncbi:putative transposase-like protein [Trichonephila clavipes]|nr:putative transposase-like protein [Trichonephila clavipes]